VRGTCVGREGVEGGRERVRERKSMVMEVSGGCTCLTGARAVYVCVCVYVFIDIHTY